MMKMDVFTVRELREKTGTLLRDAERGEVSLVTKHGRPAFLTVPFDRTVVESGARCALGVHLLEQGVLTLGQAAKIAGMSIEQFLGVLRETGIAVVDYPPDDLEKEMGVAL
jgi:prevent-host-death family protein